jgi:hypothetical protein
MIKHKKTYQEFDPYPGFPLQVQNTIIIGCEIYTKQYTFRSQ